jgi:membrane protease YdiL (CAAX protease family)
VPLRGLSPEDRALFEVVGVGVGLVLLADLALLWVLMVSRAQGRRLLARRWSAAHVLVGFQAWLWLTLVFACVVATAIAVLFPGGGMARDDSKAMGAVIIASLIAQNVAMVGVVLYAVIRLYDQLPVAAGLSLRNWGPRATIGLLAAAVLIPVSEGLERLSVLALRHASPASVAAVLSLLQRSFEQQNAQFMGSFKGPGGLGLAILVIALVGPFGEEVFFRGFAYRCFRARWGPTVAVVASAALFSLVHLNPAGLLPIFAIGCALAYLYERTGTLVAPFTLHAVNNFVAVLVAYFHHGR